MICEGVTIKLYGRVFQVTAIFIDQGEANAFMLENEKACVLATQEPYIFIANKDDKGVPA